MAASDLILLAPVIPAQTEPSVLIWLIPSLLTLFLYGVGQGLVKMWISEVPPARFCLYFVVAKALVNLTWFMTHDHPNPFSQEGRLFLLIGVFAYILDGTGWILYFQSIVYGPITIVGTLSAAYPAITIIFARIFLAEQLTNIQYLGVILVILCCLGLSYAPADPNDPDAKITSKRWIPLAFFALILWSAAQTVMKYCYSLPESSEVNMLLFNTIGGALTLGVFGLRYGLKGTHSGKEWIRSFMPMGMMAAGDMGVIIASSKGPISIISPLTGAYPMVTLAFAAVVLKEHITKFQWACIIFLLIGIYLTSIVPEEQPPATEAKNISYLANLPAFYEKGSFSLPDGKHFSALGIK
jgi:drug/metabolite transporter (DMT)-like permease